MLREVRAARTARTSGIFGPCALARIALLLLAAGCARLPALVPLSGVPRAEVETICLRPFPDRPWRAVHALHISGPLGHASSVLGVTVVDPSSRRIRAVILSLEGIVLFDASRDAAGGVTVHRAVPPLDRKGFPEGLMRDVALIFLAPATPPDEAGLDREGHPVCRWQDPGSGTADLVTLDPVSWRILTYAADRSLEREADLTAPEGGPLASRIRLVSHGFLGYSLDLSLIEVEFLDGDVERLFTAEPGA